ncbi:MAG: hypothetical protein LBE14_08695, partial [Treponema sp.]|nr:hypothetical protein [Treponema sp.]
MSYLKKIVFGIGVFILLAACDNPANQPLRAGLGEVVDIDPPKFRMDPHELFLRGEETFTGAAEDDISVDTVEVRITVIRDGAETVYDYIPVAYNKDRKTWSFSVDTAVSEAGGTAKYPDGPFSLRFRVTDNAKKVTETGEFSFTVKNAFPTIEMSIPSLNGTRKGTETWPENETGFNDPRLNDKLQTDQFTVPSSGTLVGVVSDLQGIAPGYPKVKFWPAGEGTTPPGDGFDAIRKDDDNNSATPDVVYGGWREVETNETAETLASGPTSLQFSFPLTKWFKKNDGSIDKETLDALDPGDYYFQFKVKDIRPETPEVVYPVYKGNNDYPNQAVKITLVSPKSTPVISLYSDDEMVGAPRPNKYITEDPDYKNGPFVLRVQAQDQDGIKSARLTVRKDGDSGTFPDRGDESKYVYFNTPLPSGGSSNPNGLPEDPGFDYLHDGESKRFDYTASTELTGSWGPGVYRYTVRVTSKSGNWAQATYRVYLDTERPSIDMGNILGVISDPDLSQGDTFLVNGTIAIPVNIYDNIALMNNTVGSDGVQEKKWILAKKNFDITGYLGDPQGYSQKAEIEAAFAPGNTPNPLETGSTLEHPIGDYFTGPGTTGGGIYYSPMIKPIDGTNYLTLDTTKYYNEAGILGDKDDTWYFYIYAMDRAYNRQIRKLTFKINQDYDKPVITDAAAAAGLENWDDINASKNPGNMFTANSKFSLTLTDDDGLDVSASPISASPKITIKGVTAFNTPPAPPTLGEVTFLTDIFGTEDGQKTRTGTLTQSLLAQKLYADPSAQTLRDGLYTVTVSAKDRSASKQYPAGHTPNPGAPGDP